MGRMPGLGVLMPVLVTAAFAACTDSTAPVPKGPRWALVSINGVSLPATPAGISYTVLADTLQFGVTSSFWKPKPLAVAKRYVIDSENAHRTEEWWMTYDVSEPLPSPFSIRIMCGDGDPNSIIDCLNGNGQASLDADGLTIRFDEPILGVLKYSRVP